MNIVTTHWYTRHVLFSCVAVLVIISYGARDHLYCTQPELPLAYENPTFFCQFSGRLACMMYSTAGTTFNEWLQQLLR